MTLSVIIIVLLALLLLVYVAIPLLFGGQVDPLPDNRDPVTLNLQEERDALFRAIRELELRDDLAQARRDGLRARYEAKAAKVLRALDERETELKTKAPVVRPAQPRRVPYAALSLLGGVVVTAAVMSGFILPRIGENGTVTTTDIPAAEAIRDLQRAANDDPNADTLLALGDAYWQLEEADQAEEVYQRIVREIEPVPAAAYRRLGFLRLRENLSEALPYLEQARAADPTDLDTLFALGEVYFSTAQPDAAIEALETFLAQPEGAGDEEVTERLETFRTVAPVLNEATANPSEESLLALGDVYWQSEERDRAAEIYARVLETYNPDTAVALSRIGQVLFFAGRNEEAIELFTRAREADATDLPTLLFLGNAYFSLDRLEEAIGVWESYVEVAGEGNAGRVPGLIEDARARLAGEPVEGADSPSAESPAGEAVVQVSARELYTDNCAACHGPQGQGGSGPALAGNRNALREANVRNIIEYGRGTMPGYGAQLSEAQLTKLTDYVVNELATDETSSDDSGSNSADAAQLPNE